MENEQSRRLDSTVVDNSHPIHIFFVFSLRNKLFDHAQTKDPNGGQLMSSSSSSMASSVVGTNTTSKHQEEMRKVRQRQQEIADERAKEAAIKRKEKEAQEKDRKNHIAKKRETGGSRLGDGGGSSSGSDGRNPMQPWTSNEPTYRYVESQQLLEDVHRVRQWLSHFLTKLFFFSFLPRTWNFVRPTRRTPPGGGGG
jgi:hypothetical protein